MAGQKLWGDQTDGEFARSFRTKWVLRERLVMVADTEGASRLEDRATIQEAAMPWWGWIIVVVAVIVVLTVTVIAVQARRRRGGVISGRGGGRRR